MKIRTSVFLCIIFTNLVLSQNPISPPGIFIADPSAHVWKDGKLYIYGSLDESCDYYCSWKHHVLFTTDMKTWTLHENAISSKGEHDEISYNDDLLFAPDCAFHNNIYYLYYCQPGKTAEGVATSANATGTFTKGKKIELAGHNQIDPSLFIDNDGQAYYLWGQFSLKMAKMKPSMTELDLSTLKDSIITEGDHHFHEGAFMAKRNGIYYIVYADISRSDMPTCIGYSTSRNPFGPYKYGGVIIDNDHCNPGNWNNHGSIAEFRGQWYVFYHRSTQGCNKMRKACVEKIYFREDGSIPEVEMTSQGASGPLDAKSRIEAEQACLLMGNARIQTVEGNNEGLAQIENGDKAAFKYIDFRNGVRKINLRVNPGSGGERIVVYLDQPWYKKIGDLNIMPGSKSNHWETLSFEVEKTTGVHALWLQFYGKGTNLFNVDWFCFE